MRGSGSTPSGPGLSSRRWNLAALLVFVAALAFVVGDVWRAGPSSFVSLGRPVPLVEGVVQTDVVFEAWLVARNARTLVREPWRLFDTPHCAPGEKTLTLGVPMITMGLLGIPAVALGEPILTYNFALAAVILASAIALYLLVTDWTGVPAAGITAGLLFGFHDLRIANLFHPAEFDIAWTALALFFGRRLFADGRWRDAVGLALACSLQIAASFYSLIAAVFLAPPLVAWLVLAYGVRRLRPARVVFVAAVVALATLLVLGPYLEQRGASPGHLQREAFLHFYAAWREYLPGQLYFPGWLLLGLATIGLALPRRLAFPGLPRDPRWAIAAGGVLVAIISGGSLADTLLAPFGVGPDAPVPYLMLASVLPGLDSVRVILRLVVGVLFAVSLLAAAAVAGGLRLSGRLALPVSIALVALAAAEALLIRPALESRVANIRPPSAILDFFAELERQDNRGPILELPYVTGFTAAGLLDPPRILVSAWHQRRTSACYGSYTLPGGESLGPLAAALPDPRAVRELARLGFTTIVVHDPKGWYGAQSQQPLVRGTGNPAVRLRPLLETNLASSFAIEVDPPSPPTHGSGGLGDGRAE